jgi:hypothetical protein
LITEKWRKKVGLVNGLQHSIVDAIMGVDAASFSPTKLPGHDGRVMYCFLFHVMPINPHLPSFTVHMFPHSSPSMGIDGVHLYNEFATRLKRHRVRVVSFASDGDRGNIRVQKELLKLYKHRLDQPCVNAILS